MIRIIHGKRYDTAKATRVCDCGSNGGFSSSDFRWHDTGLYVTAQGRWFIAGSGGALSRWARPYGQSGACGGAGVEPLTKDEALVELEQRGETEAIEKYFGESVSDA
jgi:hypothetical protein